MKLSAPYAIEAGLNTNHSAIVFSVELFALMFLATDNAQILVLPHCYLVVDQCSSFPKLSFYMFGDEY